MLVHLKREVAEFEGYPLECDVPEEQVAVMEERGWTVAKTASSKTTEKPLEEGSKKSSKNSSKDENKDSVDTKEATDAVSNHRKGN